MTHGVAADPTEGAGRSGWQALTARAGPWLVGVGLALVILGPALTPGALFNLDLVLTPQVPVPGGVWGLGPELPRRIPFILPVAWSSMVISGEVAGKAFMFTVIVVGVVGAYRLAVGASTVTRYGVAVLYGAGPLLVTRLAVGHFNVALAAALLPWVMPRLLRPDRSLARTFLASAMLALSGPAGGFFAVVIVVVGLIADRVRRWPIVLGAVVLAQLVWLVPGLVLIGAGSRPSSSTAFATRADGVLGLPRLAVGQGFWQQGLEVGSGSLVLGAAGLVLIGLAVLGWRAVEVRWGSRVLAVAAVGALLPLASATPGLRVLIAELSANPVGAALRDTHRVLPLLVVWVAVAAAHGATQLGARQKATDQVWRVAPLAIGLVCLGPALWGAGGQLEPIPLPSEWTQARQAVRAEPGPVLALPWSQYFNLTAAGGRRTHQPMPAFLGGDVLIASDPNLGQPAVERADPREPSAARIVALSREGHLAADALARLGVRWVIVLHSSDWTSYTGILDDPAISTTVSGPTLELLRVDGWQGDVVDGLGRPHNLTRDVAPLVRADDSAGGRWARPGGRGWLRGWDSVGTTTDGLADLPAGGPVIWYWPAVLVIVAEVVWVIAVVVAARRIRREFAKP